MSLFGTDYRFEVKGLSLRWLHVTRGICLWGCSVSWEGFPSPRIPCCRYSELGLFWFWVQMIACHTVVCVCVFLNGGTDTGPQNSEPCCPASQSDRLSQQADLCLPTHPNTSWTTWNVETVPPIPNQQERRPEMGSNHRGEGAPCWNQENNFW